MIATILSLRVKQGVRMIQSVGIVLTLVALVVFSGMGFRFLGMLLSLPAWWALPLVALSLGSLHFSRKDLQFLSGVLSRHKYLLILSFEYLLLVAPVFGYQVILGNYPIAAGVMLAAIVVSLLPKGSVTLALKSRPMRLSFIPIELYELRIIIERYWLPFVIFWLISFLGFYHAAYFLVALLGMLVILVSAFTHNEPLELLRENRNFLNEKLGINIGFGTLLFLVPFSLTLYFHNDNYLLLIYGYLYFVTIMTLAICYKYASYDPLRSTTLNSNFITVVAILSLLPGLILGAMIALVYYYFLAHKRLAYYI